MPTKFWARLKKANTITKSIMLRWLLLIYNYWAWGPALLFNINSISLFVHSAGSRQLNGSLAGGAGAGPWPAFPVWLTKRPVTQTQREGRALRGRRKFPWGYVWPAGQPWSSSLSSLILPLSEANQWIAVIKGRAADFQIIMFIIII